MNAMMSAEALAGATKLREMGARIQFVNSKMCYVRFEVDGIQVEYAYSVNTTGKYYLERIKPYPLPLREFVHEARLIEIIEIDLDQFRNAIMTLQTIAPFIDTGKAFHHTFLRFEDLYLYYDVPEEVLKEVHGKLKEIDDLIKATTHSAKRIYHRKEPDTL